MGLVERFSKLRSRWSRSFPPNLARLMLLGCAALWGGSYLPNSPWRRFRPNG